MAKSGQAQGTLRALDGAAGKSTGGMSALTKGFTAFGLAAIPAMLNGVKSAANLEQAIANINASLGGLDAGTLDELTEGFQRLGAESQFSATEVAAVGDELAKAGYDPEQIIGMTKAVVELSQATGSDLMTSMDGITNAMALWNETVVGTELAITDASRAADVLTVAANESKASVQDIIVGVRNLGPMAGALGISFEETSGAIAFFTTNGMKAADAGLSITRGLQDLLSPTAEAQAEMDKLGIAAFDLEGNFIGLPALFDQLQMAYKDMSPAARAASLDLIFGQEAIDAMTIAALNGGDPLRALMELYEGTGIAAEQSALRMDTLGAQFDTLKEGISTFLGSLVQGLMPAMRAFVDGANVVVDALMRIPGPIKTVIAAIAALAAGFAALKVGSAALNLLGVGGIGGMFAGLTAGPILAFAAGIGIAYAAIKFNLFGIGDAIGRFIDAWNAIGSTTNNPLSRLMSSLVAALDPTNTATGMLGDFADFLDTWSKRIEKGVDRFQDVWDLLFGDADTKKKAKNAATISDAEKELAEANEFLTDAVLEAHDPVSRLNTLFERGGLNAMGAADDVRGLERAFAAAQFPATRLGGALAAVGEGFRAAGFEGIGQAFVDLGFKADELSAHFQEFRDRGAGPVGAALLALGETFPSLRTAMDGLAGVTTNLGDAFDAAIQGDWSQAFEELGMAASAAWTVIQEIGSGIGGLVVDLAGWAINTAVPAITGWVADNAGDIGRAVLDAAGWAWDNIIVPIGAITLQVLGWLVQAAGSAWEYVKAWVLGQAPGVAGGAGSAGGQLAGMAGGSIPIGPVLLLIQGWLVESASSAWEAIKAWVLGTGGGSSGMGRAAGGGLATAAGTGIPMGAVRLAIEDWEIVADAADVWSKITDWLDTNLQVSDADVAAFEPKGREIGAAIMRTIIDGITSGFSMGGAPAGDGTGGATGPSGGPSELHEQIWAYLNPILDGMWTELEPELEAWGQGLKQDFEGWWNGFMPSIFEFSRDYTLGGGGFMTGAEAFGMESNPFLRGIEDMFTGIYEGAQEKWETFKTDFTSLFTDAIDIPSIDIPSIDIDWPDIPEPPADLVGFLSDPIGYIKNKAGGGDGKPGSQGSILEGFENTLDTLNVLAARVRDAAARIGSSLSASGGFGGPKTMVLPELSSQITGMLNRANAAASAGLAAIGATISSAAAGWAAALTAQPMTVTVTADTSQATAALGQTTGAMAALNGQSSTIQVLGDNAGALAAVAGAAGALGGISGASAMTFVNGDNSNALGAVAGAAGAMAGFDGTTATGTINAVSFVEDAVNAARGALASIDGMTATVYINTAGGGAGIGAAVPRATGGTVREPWTLVGERGAELVSLPYGSYVHTANASRQMMGGGGGNTTIHVHVDRAYGIDDLAGQVFAVGLPELAAAERQQRTAAGVR